MLLCTVKEAYLKQPLLNTEVSSHLFHSLSIGFSYANFLDKVSKLVFLFAYEWDTPLSFEGIRYTW